MSVLFIYRTLRMVFRYRWSRSGGVPPRYGCPRPCPDKQRSLRGSPAARGPARCGSSSIPLPSGCHRHGSPLPRPVIRGYPVPPSVCRYPETGSGLPLTGSERQKDVRRTKGCSFPWFRFTPKLINYILFPG